MKRIIVGITGASGSIYGVRLVEELLEIGYEVHLLLTDNGAKVTEYETGFNVEKLKIRFKNRGSRNIIIHRIDNLFASVASGSFDFDAMVVVPCSMASLSGIASGTLHNLLGRAADVSLKERRKLIVVPREAPFNRIHLKSMLSLDEAGAIILPASPGFYFKPKTVDDLVNFVVGRILNTIGIKNSLIDEWSQQ